MNTRYPGLKSPGRMGEPFAAADEEPYESAVEFVERISPRRERPRGNRATSVLIDANAVCHLAQLGQEDFDEGCAELLRFCKSEPSDAERARNVAKIEIARGIREGRIDDYKLRQSGMISVGVDDGVVRLRDESGRVGVLKNTQLNLVAPDFERPQLSRPFDNVLSESVDDFRFPDEDDEAS